MLSLGSVVDPDLVGSGIFWPERIRILPFWQGPICLWLHTCFRRKSVQCLKRLAVVSLCKLTLCPYLLAWFKDLERPKSRIRNRTKSLLRPKRIVIHHNALPLSSFHKLITHRARLWLFGILSLTRVLVLTWFSISCKGRILCSCGCKGVRSKNKLRKSQIRNLSFTKLSNLHIYHKWGNLKIYDL